jgi:integrase
LFPTRSKRDRHITKRLYGRIVDRWVSIISLPKSAYGIHSLRRTKTTVIYSKTGNVWAVQLLLDHTKLESTFQYLGVELDGALELAESIEL